MLKANGRFCNRNNRGADEYIMYRMMIVDDEDQERFGIQYLLKKTGIEFYCIEAENGMEALEKLKENTVDILLTDVKMPFLDGLELAKIVRERFPKMQIIFFSGYDDFTYVKQALSIQAVDYILKPVNPSEFQKVITLVVERVEKEKTMHQHTQQFQRVYALTRLLNKIPYEKLKSEYPQNELEFLEDYKRMILLEFEEDFFGKEVEDIQELKERFHDIISVPYELTDLNPVQGVLMIGGEKKDLFFFRETAKRICAQIQKEYGILCFIAISPEICAPEQIGTVYQQTEGYLEERFFHKDTYIYPIQTNENDEEVHSANISNFLNSIEEDIRFRDAFSLRKNVEIILERCRDNEFKSYIYTRFICANLLKVLYQGIPGQQEQLSVKVEELYRYHHFSEIEESLRETMEQVVRNLNLREDSSKHMIAIVEKYIHEHYKDVLSLDILADKVFLTPHYLSSIFRQEKGIGFNKYIKKVRMDKAEELLKTTNMKISDICKAVGYTNLSYFCKTFRNEYGVTPEKYRDR